MNRKNLFYGLLETLAVWDGGVSCLSVKSMHIERNKKKKKYTIQTLSLACPGTISKVDVDIGLNREEFFLFILFYIICNGFIVTLCSGHSLQLALNNSLRNHK